MAAHTDGGPGTGHPAVAGDRCCHSLAVARGWLRGGGSRGDDGKRTFLAIRATVQTVLGQEQRIRPRTSRHSHGAAQTSTVAPWTLDARALAHANPSETVIRTRKIL